MAFEKKHAVAGTIKGSFDYGTKDSYGVVTKRIEVIAHWSYYRNGDYTVLLYTAQNKNLLLAMIGNVIKGDSSRRMKLDRFNDNYFNNYHTDLFDLCARRAKMSYQDRYASLPYPEKPYN